MGKNLGLDSTGTHIAFVGGTGILVFIDLVAYLIRLNLDLLKAGDDNILDGNKFRFVLYASFTNPDEVLGKELIEGLQTICKKKGVDNFELIYRFSNQKPLRWDSAFIDRQLQIHQRQSIKRIWVCGPPVMNEVFDKTLELIGPQYGVTRHHYEVM